MTFDQLVNAVKKSYMQIAFLKLVSIGALALGLMLGANPVLAGVAIAGGIALIIHGSNLRGSAADAFALRDATYVTYVGVALTAGTLFVAGTGFLGFVMFLAGVALIAVTGLLTGVQTVATLAKTVGGEAVKQAVDARFAAVDGTISALRTDVDALKQGQQTVLAALDGKADKKAPRRAADEAAAN
jgi:hypothetical protein